LKTCSNKECCKHCRYVMFKGTMTKWTKTDTRDDTKTLTTSWCNRHLENIYFCVFRIFIFFIFFFIDYFLKEFSKKCWVTALVRSMIFIGGLNQFKAIANWWKRKPSGNKACTRKQQPRFYWSCSSVVMKDATPLQTSHFLNIFWRRKRKKKCI